MFKTNIFSKLALMTLTCVAVLVSCSPHEPKTPTNEILNKSHENPFKAELILEAGKLKGDVSFADATLQDFEPIANGKQTITWEENEKKGWHIKEESIKAFDVKTQAEAKDLLYLFRIVYYNAKGEVMNEQFVKNGQDKIHQHFFSIRKNGKRVRQESEIPYEYTYQDTKVWNDDSSPLLGKGNPLGFKGLLRFKPWAESLEMLVILVHARNSKYEEDKSVNPFYYPGNRLLAEKEGFDISIRVPFIIKK